MPPTSAPNCDFIQMEYYVHAVARTHSFYDDIVVKLPIVIVGDKGPVEKEDIDAPPEDAEDKDGDDVLIDMDEEDEVEDEESADDEKGDEADEDDESLGEILGNGDSE